MTSKEFILWLKGFTDGVHEYNITPKQWDLLKERLAEVSDEERIGTPIGVGGWGTPNTFITPPPIDPLYPYKITCTPGTTITTTPGSGSITIANPPFGFGSTSTTYGYPSGSAWSYTTYNDTMGTIGTKPKTQKDYQREHSKPLSKKRKAKSVKEWEDEIDLGGGE